MRFGSAFVRLYTKDLKEKNGARWLHYHYRELHQAAGVKKHSDRQKAKAVWIMESGNGQRRSLLVLRCLSPEPGGIPGLRGPRTSWKDDAVLLRNREYIVF